MRQRHILVALTACILGCEEAPGEGSKALAGFRQSAAVLVALEAYRDAHGTYPDSLRQLVPGVLEEQVLTISHGNDDGYPLTYRVTESGFELSFSYVGPGMNQCTFSRVRLDWHCQGAF